MNLPLKFVAIKTNTQRNDIDDNVSYSLFVKYSLSQIHRTIPDWLKGSPSSRSISVGFQIKPSLSCTNLIDLSAIFSKGNNYPADSSFEQFKTYVSLTQVGNATEIQVATDVTASDFTTLAKLKGIQADALSAQNFILE